MGEQQASLLGKVHRLATFLVQACDMGAPQIDAAPAQLGQTPVGTIQFSQRAEHACGRESGRTGVRVVGSGRRCRIDDRDLMPLTGQLPGEQPSQYACPRNADARRGIQVAEQGGRKRKRGGQGMHGGRSYAGSWLSFLAQ